MFGVKSLSLPNPAQLLNLPKTTKLTVLGVSATFALIGLFTALLRWKKRKRGPMDRRRRFLEIQREKAGALSHSPNGDLRYRSRSPSSIRSLLREKSLTGSNASDRDDAASTTSTIIHPLSAVDTADMNPQQLCTLGLDTLQQAISYWEDAVMKMGYLDDLDDDLNLPAVTDPDTAALQHHLEHLLEMAYHMQDSYEREVVRTADHMVFDTAIAAFTETENAAMSRTMSVASSDMDSFVSATDLADLSDLDQHRDMFQHLALYEAGLLELKHGSVSCRTLRTEMTHCLSDTEFLAKLHCIRLGLQKVFESEGNREYFTDMGRTIINSLLQQADRDCDDFNTAFTAMMEFVNNADNLSKMEDELRGRGVKSLTFYDVVLDFILMDAFDDLDSPPSSVIAVVNNRWLSNGFKETALSTAVWSVLKAKRRLLKYPDGFISRFYNISESVSPVLAWGFLGPESKLKETCLFFKGVVLGIIRDIFSFEKTRYTTLDALAEDILNITKNHITKIMDKLNEDPP